MKGRHEMTREELTSDLEELPKISLTKSSEKFKSRENLKIKNMLSEFFKTSLYQLNRIGTAEEKLF